MATTRGHTRAIERAMHVRTRLCDRQRAMCRVQYLSHGYALSYIYIVNAQHEVEDNIRM